MPALGLALALPYLRSAATTPVYDYAGLYASLGASGFVYDSKASAMYQSSSGSGALVAADGDPIGYITDISGSGKHATQATTANKPIAKGTELAWKTGSGSPAASAFMDVGTFAPGAACTFIAMCAQMVYGSGNGGHVLSNMTAASTWPAGIYGALDIGVSSQPSGAVLLSTGTTRTSAVGAWNTTPPIPAGIIVVTRAGTGANQTTVRTYTSDGTLLNTATGTQDSVASSAWHLGMAGTINTDSMESVFCLYADKDLSAKIADIVADLSARHSAWAPA